MIRQGVLGQLSAYACSVTLGLVTTVRCKLALVRSLTKRRHLGRREQRCEKSGKWPTNPETPVAAQALTMHARHHKQLKDRFALTLPNTSRNVSGSGWRIAGRQLVTRSSDQTAGALAVVRDYCYQSRPSFGFCFQLLMGRFVVVRIS